MKNIAAIVYTSNTGFTMRYAQLLSHAAAIPAYDLEDGQCAPPAGSCVIYLGWLSAGRIKGLSKADRKWDIQAVCAVGMAPDNNLSSVAAANRVHCPLFYAQGGYAPEKLQGMNKLIMAMVTRMIAFAQKKEVRTPEDAERLRQFRTGCDFVDEKNLAPVLAWLRE